MQICFASNNENKVKEIRSLLGGSFSIVGLSEIGCHEELAETRDTLEGNALQKAEYVFTKFNTPCFADDTGLEVEALNGEPGVYSARYAGLQRNSDDNMALLLSNLANQSNRKAQFKTVITYMDKDGAHSFIGMIKGIITAKPIGTQGFGYDPVFMPEGSEKTFGQMSLEEKNGFSHRAKATSQFVSFLKERFR